MKGIGEKPVFGFFGPAWLINYVWLATLVDQNGEGTYGDWQYVSLQLDSSVDHGFLLTRTLRFLKL